MYSRTHVLVPSFVIARSASPCIMKSLLLLGTRSRPIKIKKHLNRANECTPWSTNRPYVRIVYRFIFPSAPLPFFLAQRLSLFPLFFFHKLISHVICRAGPSLKRPRPPEKESLLQQNQHGGGVNDTTFRIDSTAKAKTIPEPGHKHNNHHHQHHQHQQCPPYSLKAPSLPWLKDRFYLNVLPCQKLRRGGRVQGAGVGVGVRVGDSGIDAGGWMDKGVGDGKGKEREEGGLLFSLERLVAVLSGEGWPDIEAAVFGTFSINMRYGTVL